MEISTTKTTCDVCMKGWEDDFIPDDQFDPAMFANFEQMYEPEDTVLVAPSEGATEATTATTSSSQILSKSKHRVWGDGCLHQLDIKQLRDRLENDQATLSEVQDEVHRRLKLRKNKMPPETYQRMMNMDTGALELKHIEGVPRDALGEAKFLVFLKWKEFSETVKSEWDVVAEEEDWNVVTGEEAAGAREADQGKIVTKLEGMNVDAH